MKKNEIIFGKFHFKKRSILFKKSISQILLDFFKIFWPTVRNLAHQQGYRYEVLYRPIPITDTDRKFSYRQNRLSADTDTYRLSVRTLGHCATINNHLT